MTWLAFTLGLIIGSLGTLMWIFIFDENELDSEDEYVDNTPTFR